jgi:hypothetical protein
MQSWCDGGEQQVPPLRRRFRSGSGRDDNFLVHRVFAGRTKQDSANQLDPFLFFHVLILQSRPVLEAKCYAGREAEVVLSDAEEAGVDVVAFQAPRNWANDLVVQTSAKCGCEGAAGSEIGE